MGQNVDWVVLDLALENMGTREAIFRMHLHGCLSEDDHRSFAVATEGLSGAEIEKVVRNARRTARRRRSSVTREDLITHLPLMLDIPAKILRANAVHEIGHAVVGTVLGMELVKVAIVDRVRVDGDLQSLGHARFRRDPWIRRTKRHYLDLIAMSLAGMAAEDAFLGGHDDGAAGNDGSDLVEATKTAMALERTYGMGAKLASYGYPARFPEGGSFDPMLLPRVDAVLQEQFDRAKSILLRHRKACTILADELASRRELPAQEILDALG